MYQDKISIFQVIRNILIRKWLPCQLKCQRNLTTSTVHTELQHFLLCSCSVLVLTDIHNITHTDKLASVAVIGSDIRNTARPSQQQLSSCYMLVFTFGRFAQTPSGL